MKAARSPRATLLAINGAAVLLFGPFSGGLMAMCRDAIVKALTVTKDRNLKSMAFVELFLGDGTERAVCFQKQWSAYKKHLRIGQLVLVELEKTGRGYSILDVQTA